LCAVPLVDGGRAIGALVVQRRRPRAFGQREVVLIASMTAPILFALERARLRDAQRVDAAAQTAAPAAASARAHEVILRGVGVAPGSGLGTTRLVRYARGEPIEPSVRTDVAEEHARLTRALAEAADEMARLEAWALRHAPLERSALTMLLAPARFVLDDARLRERMIAQVEAGVQAEAAIERVMREYTRLLANSGDPALMERAVEVETLCRRARACLALAAPRLAPGTILLASRLTVCDAIELGARHGVGAALAASAAASPGVPLARALQLPVLVDIGDLFRWAADGDRALLNADSGTLILNPSAVDIATHRVRS
jgi:phosphotransferase system enzyme I (PtsP)